jgi:hypothetical protein
MCIVFDLQFLAVLGIDTIYLDISRYLPAKTTQVPI